MARVPKISEEVRAQVIADLLTGAAVNATAKKYSLSPATVSRLRAGLSDGALKQIETEKQEGIADLLLILVSANVHAMKRISITVSEPDYLQAQKGAAVAEIYRAIGDTTLSILEAAGNAGLDTETG